MCLENSFLISLDCHFELQNQEIFLLTVQEHPQYWTEQIFTPKRVWKLAFTSTSMEEFKTK